MLPSEVYARKSRRWGTAAIASYVAIVGSMALIGRGILDIGALTFLALVAGIICMITTCATLIRWTQCDVSDGRFFSRPGHAFLVRLAPGFAMMCAAVYPEYQVRSLLFISGIVYLILSAIGEFLGSAWAHRLELYPPSITVAPRVTIVSLYVAIFGFYAMALIPEIVVESSVVAMLLALGFFDLRILRQGSLKRGLQSRQPPKGFLRPVTPRERMGLVIAAGLAFAVAAFGMWLIMNHWL